jgi:recyclin-1
MFEINMDEYLDEEVESVKQAFEVTCKEWDRQVGFDYPDVLHTLTLSR